MNRTQSDQVQSYEEAARWIYERINYERIPPVRVSPHFQLERVRRQLALIGSPQDRIPAVHIAGTKGKGSTAAMIDSILRASGVRTGLFTSPHIERFEERMVVSGQAPDPPELTSMVAELQRCLASADEDLQRDPPTYFEVATLLAWMYFDRQQVELAVLETGLGGRLDCTNVCRPLVTVITSISLDHTAILGDTVEQIAAEKAGIIKQGIPVVLGVTGREVISVCCQAAERHQAPVYRLHQDVHPQMQEETRVGQRIGVETPWRRHDELTLSLLGRHQADNAALAVTVADLLAQKEPRITAESIGTGLQQTLWPLRFEVIPGKSTIILDAAHNREAAAAVVRTLNSGQWPEKPRVLVFGASRDKDVHGMLEQLLPEFEYVIFTHCRQSPRSCAPEELQAVAADMCDTTCLTVADEIEQALERGCRLAGPGGLLCITGSVFLAAACRTRLRPSPQPKPKAAG